MRVIRIAGVCVLAAIVIVSASRAPAPNPLTPAAYLDRALALIQTNALAAPALDWAAVTQHAHQLAADAKTPEETYPAIEYVLSELSKADDLHARFFDPLTAKLGGGTAKRSPVTQAPAVTLVHKRLGQITLPGLLNLPESRAARRYVANALSGIESLGKRSHPCGWIVDLRGDTGGNAYSMLLAIGPIIGEGKLLGLTGRKGFAYWISYHNSTVSGPDRYSVQAPLKVAPLAPAPPVAVLTGPLTASAGEFVTVAFRARPQTRSFGLPTAGYNNGPQVYRLADGAELVFGIYDLVDRHGLIYKHPIAPDTHVLRLSTDEAAAHWLLTSTTCSRHL